METLLVRRAHTVLHMTASASAAPAEGELALLDTFLELLTSAHRSMRDAANFTEPWLANRSWRAYSHIGNREPQARFYYNLTRRLRPRRICEIGMNGGHSVAVLLAAAGRHARFTMFDLEEFSHSASTL